MTSPLALLQPNVPSCSTKPGPVGGRLSSFADAWRRRGCSPLNVKIIANGFRLKFLDPPVLSSTPFEFPMRKDEVPLLWKEAMDMVQKGAVAILPPSPTPTGFYSRLFLVPKGADGFRPIIDLSTLNQYLVCPSFRMDTQESIRHQLQRGDWTTSLDLKDAYFHLAVHPSSRRFMRFVLKKTVFEFKALPFGLSPAPWIFTMIMSEVKAMAHSMNVKLYQYLDDWLIVDSSRQAVAEKTRFLVNLCTQLGLVINFPKSDLTPAQDFEFLGYHYDLKNFMVRPTAPKVLILRERILLLLQGEGGSARRWLSVIGTMESLWRLIPWSRLQIRVL